MLTKTRSRKLARLRDDFGYWARCCYQIRDKHAALVPLRLNHAQRVVLDAERAMLDEEGVARLYILKARQGGITTAEQAKNLHTAWSTRGAAVMTLAHSRDDTDKIFRITRRAIDNFPEGLLPEMGRGMTREISFPGLDSMFWTGTAGAKRTGRGVTLRAMHGSEFAFWDEPLTTLNAIMPAMMPRLSSVRLETTASAHGSEAHGYWTDAENGTNGFRAVFLPWWVCDYELYRVPLDAPDELGTLEPEEQHLVDNQGLDLEQIKWRRETMARMGRSRFMQEYAEDPESCWLVAGDLFYDGEVLKTLYDRAPKPKRKEAVHVGSWSGEVLIYGWQEGFAHERERVIGGVDVAEGGGGDRTTWVFRTFPSWKLLETFQSNTIEPKAAAALFNERARGYGKPLLVVEKNGHGITVLRELRDTHRYPAGKLYHRSVFDKQTKMPTLTIGWATTGETKPLLLDAGRELLNAALAGTVDVPGVEALRDAFNVTRDKTGKIDLNGRDMLVAEMLAWQGRDYNISGTSSFMATI